jgi:CubicO group peptidase (beta-lactamase class C family)
MKEWPILPPATLVVFISLMTCPMEAAGRANTGLGRGPQDAPQVEAFFDGLLAGQLEAYAIAGAAVAIVRDGKVLLAKGYGFADAQQRTPVSAEATLFRMASISKLFTWTAAMQLAEQGRLDLKRDVNSYLDTFRIPDTFPQPITLEHLMTHTAGFEDLVMGIGARRKEDVLSLEEYLRTRQPKRIRPPGVVTAYSNYGTALAGYIVQRIAGRPFEEYVEEAIFKPLGMARSTFRQPPPDPLAKHVSRGHIVREGLFLPQDFEFVNGIAPAGALSSTVSDMARFMIAHLELGAYCGTRLLGQETARIMHKRLFTNDPRLSGNAHGFWERQAHGLRIIGHGGDTWLFHSQLILIPEERIGLLVVYNTQTAASPARDELVQAFLDKFYPAPVAIPPQPQASARIALERYAGWYGLTRNASSNLEKAMRLVLVVRVKATEKGTLMTHWPAGLGSRHWVEVESGVFRRADGRDTLVFRTDDRGRVTYAFLDSLPMFAGARLRGLEAPVLHWVLEGTCLLIFLFVLMWPLGWLKKKACRLDVPEKQAPWPAKTVTFIFSLLNLAFFGCLVAAMLKPEEFLLGVPPPLRIGLYLPLASMPFLALSVIYSALSWIKKYWTLCGRLFYALAAAAGIVFIMDLVYWNCLGFLP